MYPTTHDYNRSPQQSQSPIAQARTCIQAMRQLRREYHAGRLSLEQYRSQRQAAKQPWQERAR